MSIAASTMLDGCGGVLQNVTVRIDGSRIAAVNEGASNATSDVRGLTLMPGWIDTPRAHRRALGADGRASNEGETTAEEALYGAENAYATLMAGFTTVQSIGSMSDVPLRDASTRGQQNVTMLRSRSMRFFLAFDPASALPDRLAPDPSNPALRLSRASPQGVQGVQEKDLLPDLPDLLWLARATPETNQRLERRRCRRRSGRAL